MIYQGIALEGPKGNKSFCELSSAGVLESGSACKGEDSVYFLSDHQSAVVTDSYLPYGNVIESMFKQDKGLLSHVLGLQSLFQCKVKMSVKNAGDKSGLNLDNLLYFLKNIPNINVPLKYRCT